MKLLLVLLGLTALFAACECAVINPVPITSNFTIGLGQLRGPESIDIDAQGFIYVSVGDGSIRKIDPATNTNTVYAYTVTLADRANCNIVSPTIATETECGRPLGIKFDKNYNLIVADAYKGLLNISRADQSVTVLSTTNGTVPYFFTNAVIITADQSTIYFTDTSPTDRRQQFVKVLIERQANGRLLKYDVATGTVTTLLTDLVFANGIAFAKNETEIIINETTERRIRRYYLTGPNVGTSNFFNSNLGCFPDNVEYDSTSGYFLVGCYGESNTMIEDILNTNNDTLRAFYAQPAQWLSVLAMIPPRGVIPCLNQDGTVVRTLYDATGVNVWRTAEAKRVGDYIYVGSVLNAYLNRIPSSLLTPSTTTTTTGSATTGAAGSTTGSGTGNSSTASSFQPQVLALVFFVMAVILSMM